METAIKKAIEGGYERKCGSRKESSNKICIGFEGAIVWRNLSENYFVTLQREQLLLDPLFWQALGKAEGWSESGSGLWRYHWHAFIDHLASSKDIDSFFGELLK